MGDSSVNAHQLTTSLTPVLPAPPVLQLETVPPDSHHMEPVACKSTPTCWITLQHLPLAQLPEVDWHLPAVKALFTISEELWELALLGLVWTTLPALDSSTATEKQR